MNWQENNLDFNLVKNLVKEKDKQIIAIKNIPNPRLIKEIALLKYLDNKSIKNVKELRQKLETVEVIGIEPEEWWNLNPEISHKIIITFSEYQDCYNLIFIPEDIEINHDFKQQDKQEKLINISYKEYTNNPLHIKSLDN